MLKFLYVVAFVFTVNAVFKLQEKAIDLIYDFSVPVVLSFLFIVLFKFVRRWPIDFFDIIIIMTSCSVGFYYLGLATSNQLVSNNEDVLAAVSCFIYLKIYLYLIYAEKKGQ